MAEELLSRPAWWPDWVPRLCPGCGKPWRPLKVRSTFWPCSCPGATGRPKGHEPYRCAWGFDCHAVVYPPEHVAGWTVAERPRIL